MVSIAQVENSVGGGGFWTNPDGGSRFTTAQTSLEECVE